MNEFLNMLKPYKGAIIGGLIGLVVAILFLSFGFLKTLVILFLVSIGALVGLTIDDKTNILDKFKNIGKKD